MKLHIIRNAYWDTARLLGHAQSSKEQNVLLLPKGQFYFIKFISLDMLTLQSTAHRNHFSMLISLLEFFKECLHLVLGLSLSTTA